MPVLQAGQVSTARRQLRRVYLAEIRDARNIDCLDGSAICIMKLGYSAVLRDIRNLVIH